jgi:hypothetical protein
VGRGGEKRNVGGGGRGGGFLRGIFRFGHSNGGCHNLISFGDTLPHHQVLLRLKISIFFVKKKKTGYQGWTLKVHDPFTPPFVETLHYGQDPVRYIEDINQYDVPDL